MCYGMNEWTTVTRWVRRITSTTAKNGVKHHGLNLPEEVFESMCDELGGTCENSVQVVMMKNEQTGAHIIAITGFDGYETLLRSLNSQMVVLPHA